MVHFITSQRLSARARRAIGHYLIGLGMVLVTSCGGDVSTVESTLSTTTQTAITAPTADTQNTLIKTFGTQISASSYANYAGAPVPNYVTKSNAGNVENAKATLGRVLFYDKTLSIDNSVSCASCHQQARAFSDGELASKGVQGGLTGRHSMRLVNTRFAEEARFFWDKRATNLEAQVLQPIQDHNEMGFSGASGRPTLADMLTKLAALDYYQVLFRQVYGDTNVTAARVQESLTHFVRSIVSFDSKFDAGRAQAQNDNQNFANFTAQENQGKNLFLTRPVFDANGLRTSGGLGCNGCHRSPEFDIDPNSRNNGIIGKLNATGFDLINTRAPTLRDLVKSDGTTNSPMMHTGVVADLQAAIGHYGTITLNPNNNNLDARLRPNGFGQQLLLTAPEVNAVIAFLKTLTGAAVYTDAKWSDPFIR